MYFTMQDRVFVGILGSFLTEKMSLLRRETKKARPHKRQPSNERKSERT